MRVLLVESFITAVENRIRCFPCVFYVNGGDDDYDGGDKNDDEFICSLVR